MEIVKTKESNNSTTKKDKETFHILMKHQQMKKRQ